MFKIVVQQIDYDDYPMGRPAEIGPFYSREQAEDYMETSDRFYKQSFGTSHYWHSARTWGRHTVHIMTMEHGLISPAAYEVMS